MGIPIPLVWAPCHCPGPALGQRFGSFSPSRKFCEGPNGAVEHPLSSSGMHGAVPVVLCTNQAPPRAESCPSALSSQRVLFCLQIETLSLRRFFLAAVFMVA